MLLPSGLISHLPNYKVTNLRFYEPFLAYIYYTIPTMAHLRIYIITNPKVFYDWIMTRHGKAVYHAAQSTSVPRHHPFNFQNKTIEIRQMATFISYLGINPLTFFVSQRYKSYRHQFFSNNCSIS